MILVELRDYEDGFLELEFLLPVEKDDAVRKITELTKKGYHPWEAEALLATCFVLEMKWRFNRKKAALDYKWDRETVEKLLQLSIDLWRKEVPPGTILEPPLLLIFYFTERLPSEITKQHENI